MNCIEQNNITQMDYASMIDQYTLTLPEYKRGFHLITDKVLSAAQKLPSKGLMQVFIQHTSASLTINENADPSVRVDLERHTNVMAPENANYYTHIFEGSDDMPAHIKASLYGSSVSIPIVNGRIGLGTWQGIYLGEHRNQGGKRRLVISIIS
ncbi:MAG: secondary thiamine-phosphate synthase enzyme [Alphaproteobacteria bacterium]|jgi:secondary thiamine-phosphate synthase enzyme